MTRPPGWTVAILLGVVCGLVLVGSAALVLGPPPGPVTLALAGRSFIAPPSTLYNCSWNGTVQWIYQTCEVPGVAWLWFNSDHALALEGELVALHPFGLMLLEAGPLLPTCGYLAKNVTCPALDDQQKAFYLGAPTTRVDLAALDLRFDGAGNVVPSGEWLLGLVNPSPVPDPITVGSTVQLVPPSGSGVAGPSL